MRRTLDSIVCHAISLGIVTLVAMFGLKLASVVYGQEPAPLPRVVEPSTDGLDLTRWGFNVPWHVVQVRVNGSIVHECGFSGHPQLHEGIRSLALRFWPAGRVEMRVWSIVGEHWCKADGWARMDTATGWFAVEVKVHAGSVTF